MAKEPTDGDTAWRLSQLRATKIYYELQPKHSTREITSFCIHFLSSQAATDLAEIDLFTYHVKKLAGWHYIMTEYETKKEAQSGRAWRGDQEDQRTSSGDGSTEEEGRNPEGTGPGPGAA